MAIGHINLLSDAWAKNIRFSYLLQDILLQQIAESYLFLKTKRIRCIA